MKLLQIKVLKSLKKKFFHALLHDWGFIQPKGTCNIFQIKVQKTFFHDSKLTTFGLTDKKKDLLSKVDCGFSTGPTFGGNYGRMNGQNVGKKTTES